MEKYGNMAFPNKSETVKEVKLPILNQILCFLPIPVPRYCTKFRQHKIFQITRYLVKDIWTFQSSIFFQKRTLMKLLGWIPSSDSHHPPKNPPNKISHPPLGEFPSYPLKLFGKLCHVMSCLPWPTKQFVQPFIFPRSIKWLSRISGNLLVKNKLRPRSGSVALRLLNPINKKGP